MNKNIIYIFNIKLYVNSQTLKDFSYFNWNIFNKLIYDYSKIGWKFYYKKNKTNKWNLKINK